MTRTKVLPGFVALAAASVLLVGCSGVPQSVVNVPGSHTFGKQIIWGDYGPFEGPPGGTVVLCTDRNGPLHLEASFSSGMTLSFGGQRQFFGPGYSYTSAPVGPGCGTMGVTASSSAWGTLPSVTVTVTHA